MIGTHPAYQAARAGVGQGASSADKVVASLSRLRLYGNSLRRYRSKKGLKVTRRMNQTDTPRLRALSLLTTAAVAALACFVAPPLTLVAQSSHPTATQTLQLSGFGGISGVYTGLAGGKNLDITAGLDLALPPVKHIRPALEVRGSYPIDKGNIDSQRSLLAGVRANILLGRRLQPYGDFLVGRGQMNYGKGYFYRNSEYLLTTTWVFSPGLGFDYALSDHFSVKLDGQYQRWGQAPVDGGTIYAKQGTVGLVYIFDFNRRHHH